VKPDAATPPREALRAQLHAQRRVLALRLAPDGAAPGRYPRSVTMRVLLRRPELLVALAQRVAGVSFIKPVATLLLVAHTVHGAIAAARLEARTASDPALS
jgi:hypothetical protein